LTKDEIRRKFGLPLEGDELIASLCSRMSVAGAESVTCNISGAGSNPPTPSASSSGMQGVHGTSRALESELDMKRKTCTDYRNFPPDQRRNAECRRTALKKPRSVTRAGLIAAGLQQPLAPYFDHAARLVGVDSADIRRDIRAYADGERVNRDQTLEEAGLRDPDTICELFVRFCQVGGGRSPSDGECGRRRSIRVGVNTSTNITIGSASSSAAAASDATTRDALMTTINPDFYIDGGEPVTWADVHGADAVKREVDDFFLSLQFPACWRAANPRICLLLTGPPGTGKTSTARAIAHHATTLSLPGSSRPSGQHFTVFTPSGSDITAASKAKVLFQLAKEHAPSIVFIDECDSVFQGDGKDVSQRVQDLKTEIDKVLGLKPRSVLFIAATNHPDRINAAIMDRFEDPIKLPLPDADTRLRIIKTKLRDNDTSDMDEADWNWVAQATAGRNGRWLTLVLCAEVQRIGPREACAAEGVCADGEARPIRRADFEIVLAAKGGGSASAAASQQALPAPGALVVASAAAAPPAAPSASAGASQLAPLPAGGALPLVDGGSDHAKRVAACRRLFTRVRGSPRRFRHEVYAYIAEHERGAWEATGAAEQRAKAVEDPRTLKRGSRPARSIVSAWTDAMAEAFHGFEFENNRGDGSGLPRGYSTTELAFNAV